MSFAKSLFLSCLSCAVYFAFAPLLRAQAPEIISWGENLPGWSSKLKLTALREGCTDTPVHCAPYVTNLALKDHWGRARPKQILEFGGNKSFTPALIPSNECSRNCSFVAGEPSSTFAPFYAAAFVIPQWSLTLVIVGTVCGVVSGFVRIAQGAHFLSDVIFAGIFMMLIPILASRLLMVRPFKLTCKWRPSVPKNTNGPVGPDNAAWMVSLLAAGLLVQMHAVHAAEVTEEIDTQFMFGFTSGADVGELGEKELEHETPPR